MDVKFNEQKDILIAIKKEINLLHQQVDYLIRNEKPLELLDLDVMMNRTHTIYDLMCGVEVKGDVDEDEALPVGLEEIRGMFGIEEKPEEEELEEQEELELDHEEQEEDEGLGEEDETAYFIEEVEDVADEGTMEATEETTTEGITEEVTEERTIETSGERAETKEVRTETKEEGLLKDRGFILNFEPVENPVEETVKETIEETDKEAIEETAKEEGKESVYTTGDEIEMSIPQLDFGEEAVDTREEDGKKTETEEEIAYEPVVIGYMEEKEDGGFELETPETLGERLQQGQDPTLADKLQHSTLNSLQSAIGINDKFLFVNELFNGSMEKYNRSIANLDDLKTLNGALIYLNELRIELQWNSSNEAYKKLLELVHRKFGA